VAKRRLTKKRLFGLDRSGPPPERTRKGQPLRPWTIPNAVGYGRLALIPVFLIVALSSRHGQSTVAAALFAVIAWTDYLDGFLARLTGQFSRLGALLDPACDRLLVISGGIVAWRFDLLPRWLLAVVIGREVFVVLLTRYAMGRGIDIKINWLGRLAVAPTMGAPFFAMAGDGTLARVLLYLGTALGLSAVVLYLRTGRADLDKLSSSA
jgi:cardiolipin synthase